MSLSSHAGVTASNVHPFPGRRQSFQAGQQNPGYDCEDECRLAKAIGRPSARYPSELWVNAFHEPPTVASAHHDAVFDA